MKIDIHWAGGFNMQTLKDVTSYRITPSGKAVIKFNDGVKWNLSPTSYRVIVEKPENEKNSG